MIPQNIADRAKRAGELVSKIQELEAELKNLFEAPRLGRPPKTIKPHVKKDVMRQTILDMVGGDPITADVLRRKLANQKGIRLSNQSIALFLSWAFREGRLARVSEHEYVDTSKKGLPTGFMARTV